MTRHQLWDAAVAAMACALLFAAGALLFAQWKMIRLMMLANHMMAGGCP